MVRQAPTAKKILPSSLFEEVVGGLGVAVAIYVPTPDGRNCSIVALNPMAEKLGQVVNEYAQGKLLTEVFPGAGVTALLQCLLRVHETGIPESLPALRYTDENLGEGYYRNDVFRLETGQIVAVYTDVTAAMEKQAALQASEARYSLLTESLAEGIFDWDARANTSYLSPSLKAQLGFQDEEFPNDLPLLMKRAAPDQYDKLLVDFFRFLKSSDRIWDVECLLQHSAGHYVWGRCRATALRDPQSGRALRIFGVHIDIDREKRELEKSAYREQTLAALFQALPDQFFLVDKDGLILDHQGADGGYLYEAPNELIGKRIADTLPDDVGSKTAVMLGRALAQQSLVTFEYELTLAGTLHNFECRVVPMGEQRAALILRNVSKEKAAERQLKERIKELSGLYQIYRLTQAETDIHALASQALVLIASAMQQPEEVYVTLKVEGDSWAYGNEAADGEQISAPSERLPLQELELSVRCSISTPPLHEERDMLAAVAIAIELWIKDQRAQAQLEMYQQIVTNTQDQMALLDHQLRFKLVNKAYARHLGFQPSELVGLDVRDVLDDANIVTPDRDVIEKLESALRGEPIQFQQWRSDQEGRSSYLNVLYTPYKEHRGVRGVIASMHDITSLYEAEERLRRAAQVFSSSVEAVLMTDVEGMIIDANEAFCEITGRSVSEVLSRNVSILRSDRHKQTFYDDMFNDISNMGRWRGEIWIRRQNREVFPCLMTVSQVLSEQGELSGYVGVFSDITSIKENEQRLELLAHKDPLTGLFNRTQLSRSLQSRISRAHSEEQAFTLMFIDLDNFKDVNDALGHSAGDILLKQVSERLLRVLREEDVLARVGGDEFVALLHGIDTAQNASVIATKIIDTLKSPFAINHDEVQISASVGICCYPADGSDAETLLRNADTAMYQAKSAGRGIWRCYSQQMTDAARRHMLLLTSLRQAIQNDELRVVFQPKFDAHSETLCGFEALLRWHHSTLGLINTQEFILVAEQGGVINELDYWVFKRVCEYVSEWRDAGLKPPKVAVNISGRTLHDAHFLDNIAQQLREYALNGEGIQLELTETALLPSFDGPGSALSQIRDLGLGIAVDDFGTGYSSLSYLRKLPVTELKIDGSFVRDIASSPDAAAITETIFAMAKSLKLEVVAEGVETREQLDFLRQLGPLQIQGYYFSRPLSAADTRALLEKHVAALEV